MFESTGVEESWDDGHGRCWDDDAQELARRDSNAGESSQRTRRANHGIRQGCGGETRSGGGDGVARTKRWIGSELFVWAASRFDSVAHPNSTFSIKLGPFKGSMQIIEVSTSDRV